MPCLPSPPLPSLLGGSVAASHSRRKRPKGQAKGVRRCCRQRVQPSSCWCYFPTMKKLPAGQDINNGAVIASAAPQPRLQETRATRPFPLSSLTGRFLFFQKFQREAATSGPNRAEAVCVCVCVGCCEPGGSSPSSSQLQTQLPWPGGGGGGCVCALAAARSRMKSILQPP